jgi:ABC-2 type transport system permease protein
MSRPTPLSSPGFSGRRLLALVRKEGLQVVRDPSAILIAFVLPVILLFLFAYAVSLDIRQVPIGLVLESEDPSAQSLAAAFSGTRYFQVTPARDRRQVAGAVAAGESEGLRGDSRGLRAPPRRAAGGAPGGDPHRWFPAQ